MLFRVRSRWKELSTGFFRWGNLFNGLESLNKKHIFKNYFFNFLLTFLQLFCRTQLITAWNLRRICKNLTAKWFDFVEISAWPKNRKKFRSTCFLGPEVGRYILIFAVQSIKLQKESGLAAWVIKAMKFGPFFRSSLIAIFHRCMFSATLLWHFFINVCGLNLCLFALCCPAVYVWSFGFYFNTNLEVFALLKTQLWLVWDLPSSENLAGKYKIQFSDSICFKLFC